MWLVAATSTAPVVRAKHVPVPQVRNSVAETRSRFAAMIADSGTTAPAVAAVSTVTTVFAKLVSVHLEPSDAMAKMWKPAARIAGPGKSPQRAAQVSIV